MFRIDFTNSNHFWKIYWGTEKKYAFGNVPTSIVIQLYGNLLESGRTIHDSYYTSFELAYKLFERQTYLVGTPRRDQKENPKYERNKSIIFLSQTQYQMVPHNSNVYLNISMLIFEANSIFNELKVYYWLLSSEVHSKRIFRKNGNVP